MRNHTTNYRSLFATTLVLGAVATVWGKDEKLAPEFLQNSVRGNVDVIVRYKSAPLEKQHAKVAKGGGALKSKFDLIQSGHYSVPAAMLEELANDPDVEFVSPDRTVRGTLDLSMAAVNAGAAQTYRLTGAGVGIAILDSGITPQSDLRNGTISQIVYSQDFTGLGSTDDRYGHGTHVAGIVAGNGSQSMGKSSTRTLVGMAPKANIVNLRVLDDQGQGKDSNVIAAINQAIALKKTYGIRVMNLSLGRAVQGSYTRDPLCQAVEAAWKADRKSVV